jgi:hypothetical protein
MLINQKVLKKKAGRGAGTYILLKFEGLVHLVQEPGDKEAALTTLLAQARL